MSNITLLLSPHQFHMLLYLQSNDGSTELSIRKWKKRFCFSWNQTVVYDWAVGKPQLKNHLRKQVSNKKFWDHFSSVWDGKKCQKTTENAPFWVFQISTCIELFILFVWFSFCLFVFLLFVFFLVWGAWTLWLATHVSGDVCCCCRLSEESSTNGQCATPQCDEGRMHVHLQKLTMVNKKALLLQRLHCGRNKVVKTARGGATLIMLLGISLLWLFFSKPFSPCCSCTLATRVWLGNFQVFCAPLLLEQEKCFRRFCWWMKLQDGRSPRTSTLVWLQGFFFNHPDSSCKLLFQRCHSSTKESILWDGSSLPCNKKWSLGVKVWEIKSECMKINVQSRKFSLNCNFFALITGVVPRSVLKIKP